MALLLVAAGGLAREVLEALRASGRDDVIGALDDDAARHGSLVGGVPVLGGLAAVADHPGAEVLLCAGNGNVRASLAARLADMDVAPDRYATVVHPGAVVPPSSDIGYGTIMLARVVLTADVTIGNHVVVMPGAVLTHDDSVDDFATLAAGVLLGGGVSVGARAYLGMGASVREGVSVGAGAVVGMGAVVLHDVPAGRTHVGVPAADRGAAGVAA